MEKNILKEYNSKVQQLNTAFQDLVANNLVPVTHGEKSYTIENIKEVQDNLKKQEFTISVCGQINAGKSSFLNYLLFNDKEVLPVDDTPWTAKLTTVSYGEENYATVTYYSIEEWQLLKSQKITVADGVSTTYYDEFLKEDVNKAALDGLQVESFITSSSKTVAGVTLNKLRDYVAKGGRMTPFVKQVDIKVNNELAKGVVFVDTPGINDRNELRSKVTEDWIKKSCAVIYLFYVGQALNTSDYDFIDLHLSSVPTDKILFALTKADTSADYEGAKTYVEKTFMEDEELKKRKFITNNKSVFPISTLSALINYKQLNNIELNEDELYHFKRIMVESPSFIKSNGFIEEFVNGLKSHLMTQTGKAIIDKTTEFLFDIYKTNEASLLSDLNTTKVKLKDLNLSDAELKEKVANLNKLIDEIEKFKKRFERDTTEGVVDRMKSNLNIRLQDFKESGFIALKKDLEDSSNDSIKALRKLATHLTKGSLMNISNKIHNSLLNELSVKEEINDLLETFSNKFAEIIKDVNVYDGSLFCKVANPAAIVKNISYYELSVEKLKKNCGSNWGIFNRESVKSQIFSEIKIIFENHADFIIENVMANITNVIEENINGVYNNVNTEVKKIKLNSNSLLDSSTDIGEQKNIFQAEIVSAQERLDYVMSQFKSLQKCL
jgi:predicted GTPase